MQVKILYVEDELSLGKIVKHALTASGYDVCLESDGAKVVMAFNKFNPHICVLDVMLPNISGFDLAKQIKEINSNVPIIFVTAKTIYTFFTFILANCKSIYSNVADVVTAYNKTKWF